MKPTKNRVFCIECGKAKMLFESESKAMNFIKYNSDEIEQTTGHAPVRAYYCSMCGGWHVTSQKEVRANASSRISRILDAKYKAEAWARMFNEKLQEMTSLIQKQDFDKAYLLAAYIKNCVLSKCPKGGEFAQLCKKSFNKFNNHLDMLRAAIKKYAEMVDMPAMMITLSNEIDVAEVLMDCGEYWEAQAKMMNVKRALDVLENKFIMKEERKVLRTKLSALGLVA